MSSIGENIKYYRKSKKMTIRELSEQAGVPMITIQQYEGGSRKDPRKQILVKLAKALNVTIDQLYADSPILTETKNYKLIADLIPIEQYEGLTQFIERLRNEPQSIEASSKLEIEIYKEYEDMVKLLVDVCVPDTGSIYIDSIPDRIRCMIDFIKTNEDMVKAKLPGHIIAK